MNQADRPQRVGTAYIIALLVATIVVASAVLASSYQIDELAIEELIEKSKSESRDERMSALLQLSKYPDQMAVVVPVMVSATIDSDEFVRMAADIALGRLGAPASQHLKSFVESDDPRRYALGCTAVKIIGPGASQWVPQLTKKLNTDMEHLQFASLVALEGVGPHALPALKRLIELLDSPDFNIQCAACRVLANLGQRAAAAQERLVQLLSEGNVSARSHAAIALAASGLSEQHDVVGLIEKKLDAFTQIEKQRALQALARLGPKARSSAERVKLLMYDSNKRVQPSAAYAYWRITGEADEALRQLMKLCGAVDYQATTIELLGRMGPAAKPAVGLLTEKLTSAEPHIRELTVHTLTKLGPLAAAAEPDLRKLLDDPDLLIRAAAEDALLAIDPPTAELPKK